MRFIKSVEHNVFTTNAHRALFNVHGIRMRGAEFERSPDPMFGEVDPIVSFLKLGETDFDAENLRPLSRIVAMSFCEPRS